MPQEGARSHAAPHVRSESTPTVTSRRTTSRTRVHVVVLALVAVTVVAWLVLRDRARPTSALEPAHVARSVETTSPKYAPVASAARREEQSDDARSAAATPALAPTQRTGARASSQGPDTLILAFSRPDFATYEIARARLHVVDGAGREHVQDVEDATSATFEHLASGTWTVRATGAGFAHEEQRIEDAPSTRVLDLESDGVAPVRSRLVVWPDGWIRVFVTSRDGRLLTALAEDRGLDAQRFFRRGLAVLTSLEAPAHAQATGSADRRLAVFRRAPVERGFTFQDGSVGSLEPREGAPPFWARLELHGRTLAWQHVGAGARDVVFHIDSADLDLVLSSVAVRVVDASSGAPLPGVRVTLDASDSELGRVNSKPPRVSRIEARTDRDGRAELLQIVPRALELVVEHEGVRHARAFELAPGVRHDVGEVAVGRGATVDVLVVDSLGVPVRAQERIAACEESGVAPECLAAAAAIDTDVEGRARLALPSRAALVQALARPTADADPVVVSSHRSRFVRIGGGEARPAPLVVVLEPAFPVQLVTNVREVRSFEVTDEDGLVVARVERGSAARPWLVPGSYRVRGIGGDGVERGARAFVVDGSPVDVEL